MPYTKLLNDIIDRSGLSVREISRRCTAEGISVTPSYISLLRKDTTRFASDEVSRAIARVCGEKYEGVLAVEAFLDRAPDEAKGFLDFVRNTGMNTVLSVFENQFPREVIELAKEQIADMPLAELFLVMFCHNTEEFEKVIGAMNYNTTLTSDDTDIKFKAELKSATGFDVKDNSMYPIIPKGSKVIIELLLITDCKDGDMLAFVDTKTGEMYYRKVAFTNAEKTDFVMFPLNNEYPTMSYKADEIVLLGKIKQIIVDIE